jgi:hypothetical protein
MEKINSFYARLEKKYDKLYWTTEKIEDKIDFRKLKELKEEKTYSLDIGECEESYFLQLLTAYPASMVDYNMTDTLSLVIAVMYFESKLRDDENCTGLTYDDLAVLFDRSKQTIFNAIKQNERKANELLQPTKLRAEARREAEKQRLEEERQRRLNIHIVNPPNLK